MLQLIHSAQAGESEPDYDELLQLASAHVEPGTAPQKIVDRAEELAEMTVALIKAEDNPSILASVTLVIADTPLRVAFLEMIGQRLQ